MTKCSNFVREAGWLTALISWPNSQVFWFTSTKDCTYISLSLTKQLVDQDFGLVNQQDIFYLSRTWIFILVGQAHWLVDKVDTTFNFFWHSSRSISLSRVSCFQVNTCLNSTWWYSSLTNCLIHLAANEAPPSTSNASEILPSSKVSQAHHLHGCWWNYN